MASEKVEVTATIDLSTKEVGKAGSDDAELQDRVNHSRPLEDSSSDTLEVRLLNCDERD
jgi:hypothetical protein